MVVYPDIRTQRRKNICFYHFFCVRKKMSNKSECGEEVGWLGLLGGLREGGLV